MEGMQNNEMHALEVRNSIQVLFARKAGEEIGEWIEENAERVGNIIDANPHVVELFDTSPDEALSFIEQKLAEEASDITH